VTPDVARQFETIHRPRHLDIGKKQIDRPGFHDRKSVVGASSLNDGIPSLGENLGRQHPKRRFVFRHNDDNRIGTRVGRRNDH
jgi:hypothetical protein